MNDIMIDLETFGKGNNAAILTIGACRFDITTGEIGHRFSIGINPTQNFEYGDIDPKTVLWWMSQTTAAKSSIFEMLNEDSEDLDVALEVMQEVLKINSKDKLWSNGATFDLVILRNAHQRTQITCPWDYWQERDVRTIVDLGRRIHKYDPKKSMPFTGTEHNSLDDAIHQAKYISAIYQKWNDGEI